MIANISAIDTQVVAEVVAAILVAGLGWLAFRIKRYGAEALQTRHQVKLQEMVGEVRDSLTTTDRGSSVIDRFNAQDVKLDSFGEQLKTAAAARVVIALATQHVADSLAATEKIHADYRASTNTQLAKLDTNMSNISTVVMGMRAQIDTVDAKITDNHGTPQGIGDAVGRIEEAQQGQIEREMT